MSTTRVLLLILLAAFAVRAGAAVVHPLTDRGAYPDAGDYHDLGVAIAAGGDYKVPGGIAVRMPGYPLVIAGVYKIVGPYPLAVLMLQAAGGAAACWMILRMLRPVSEWAALVAAAVFALDPLSVATSASLLSEAPFAVCLVAMVTLAARLWARPDQIGAWVGFALVSAAAIYLRAAALYLPAIYVAAVLARRFSWRAAAGGAVAVGLVVLSLIPWKVFLASHAETAALRGLTSLEGISLYEAVYAGATGGPRQGEILAEQPPDVRAMPEGLRDTHYRQLAWKEIREHPARVAALAPLKVARTWSPALNADELRRPLLSVALWLWYVPLFVLAGIGLFSPRVDWGLRLMLAVPVVYFTALHAVFLGSVRYRVPLHAVLCMLAALGVMEVLKRISRPTLPR